MRTPTAVQLQLVAKAALGSLRRLSSRCLQRSLRVPSAWQVPSMLIRQRVNGNVLVPRCWISTVSLFNRTHLVSMLWSLLVRTGCKQWSCCRRWERPWHGQMLWVSAVLSALYKKAAKAKVLTLGPRHWSCWRRCWRQGPKETFAVSNLFGRVRKPVFCCFSLLRAGNHYFITEVHQVRFFGVA